MTVYLDYNASAPVRPLVLEEMIRVYREFYGNAGSRTHVFGQRAAQIVHQWRQEIAGFLGIDAGDVLFTSGATESNNLVLLGLQDYAWSTNRTHIISTALEHKSILEPLAVLSSRGFDVELVTSDTTGIVKVEEIEARLREDTLLVSVHHANNETGVVQPIEHIGELVRNTEAFFHVDAVQTFGKLAVDMVKSNIDFLTASAHKMGGPQGMGLLAMRRQSWRSPPIKPIMYGGGQQQGLRPGTLPVPLIAGFGQAVRLARDELPTWQQALMTKKKQVLEQLKAVRHHLNGCVEYTMPNTVNVSFPGVNSEALMLLIKDKYAISNGSACTSKDYQPSHVLVAMGLPEELIESAVRISWSREGDRIDLGELIAAVRYLSGR